MTITRVGTNKKFADGWAAVFGKGTKGTAAASTKKKATKKKPAKKAKK